MQARWEALWAASPQRSPFSAWTYVRALADVLDVPCDVHFVRDDGVDVAGALVLWRRRGWYRQIVVPPLTPYAALLTRAPVDEASVHARRSAFERLLGALEARYGILRFALPPAFTDVRAARWRGWEVRPFYTYHLTPSDALIQTDWSAQARRTIRRAAGVFRIDESNDGGTTIAHLCAASYHRHERRPPMSEDRMARLIDRLRADGMVRLFCATPADAGEAAGGLAVLHDGITAAYWIAGSRPGPAMTVLLGDVLPRLGADGITDFDFVGANTPSIAEFKRRLGGRLQPYYRIETFGRPELALFYRLLGR